MTDRDNYNKIFENGLSHLNSAKLLAENNEYGHAISHLILGLEELIKYQVYKTCKADKSVFKKEESTNIFKQHQTKHNLLTEFIEASSNQVAETFQEYILYSATGMKSNPEHIKILENRFKEIGYLINGAFSETNFTEEERTTFIAWLKDANNNKNNGFYVDLRNDIWISPKDFLRSDYEIALKYFTVILSQTQIIKDLNITDDEFINMLNSYD
ncbi:AbiV family abortive infection protein [Cytophagaceae bacterium 50C-KIRBA]|uniref:AbiV family abortive infection protein n=1 Tax=Aquirufa beregesia TaxID=2516556 RepID=A0ABX0EWK0_9BACT|nr:AbiV family abortive infection protein [Aquirufa beregesia]NGZ44285.1 AbiV family abortive infection protein [Aquirufa beregesia]